jgi:F-type H+-transporting ATPase subunit b
MSFRALAILLSTPSLAQAAEGGGGLLTPSGGLMIWTVAIFLGLMFILTRYAYKPLLAAVEAREKSLEDAIAKAQADREESAKLLAAQREQLEAARGEAQKFIADGRLTAEKLKATMIEETKVQQQEMLERARRELESEKVRAIADLRREAVHLALAGASRVIAKNLDNADNRKLVDDFLSSLPATARR